MKFFHIVKYNKNIELYFLNILLLKYSNFTKGHSTYSYIDIFSNKSSKIIFDRILRFQNIKQYEHIFIIRPKAFGETYMFNYFYKALIEKYNIMNSCIIVVNPSQKCLLQVFGNESYLIDLDFNKMNSAFKQNIYKYKKHIFHIYPNVLKDSIYLFENFESGMTYPNALKNNLKINNYNECHFNFNSEMIKNVKRKLQNLGLNFEKVILFLPEAHTIESLNSSFWKELANDFDILGYDVIYNVNNTENFSKYTPNLALDIDEVLYLASISKCIVALRSGLCEPMTRFNTMMQVIYTAHKFSNISSAKMLDFSRLTAYPMVSNKNILEYDKSCIESKLLRNLIIENFKKKMENEK